MTSLPKRPQVIRDLIELATYIKVYAMLSLKKFI